MDEPIFQTSIVGIKVFLYRNRLTSRILGIEKSVPLKSIASIEVGMPGLQRITVRTSGGEKINFVVRLRDKAKLRDAIYSAMQG